MLKAVELTKSFRGPNGLIPVLREVNLEVGRGRLVFVLGRSGSGKSTLLHILAGLDRPTSGAVEFEGASVHKMNDRQAAKYRNEQVGFVFQFFHLMSELTVMENVVLPGLIRGKSDRARAQELLKRVDLWHRRDHFPNELSGGEQQRAAIARALVNRPEIVFCDEPTGNLDNETARSIQDLIVELNRGGQAFLVVTHDEVMAQTGDQTFYLHDGKTEMKPLDGKKNISGGEGLFKFGFKRSTQGGGF